MKHLAKLLSNWRWSERLTVREAASIIGLGASTYSRLERGYPVDGSTLVIVLGWLLQTGGDVPPVEPENQPEIPPALEEAP